MPVATVKIAERNCCPKCEREIPHPEIVISHICPPPPASDLSDSRHLSMELPPSTGPSRKVVYIAGPMRGYAEFNFPAFDEARDRGLLLGFQIVSPADMDRERNFFATGAKGEDGELANFDMDAAIHADIEAILAADAIAMLPGWEKSTGAKAEYRIAVWAKKEVLDALTFQPLKRDAEMPLTPKGSTIRQFETGATRNNDVEQLDYEGFLSPIALRRFAQYMHKHRLQSDGTLRASDNWQKGIPLDAYMKSGLRHAIDWWLFHDGADGRETIEEALCALLFNVQGYLHEYLKATK